MHSTCSSVDGKKETELGLPRHEGCLTQPSPPVCAMDSAPHQLRGLSDIDIPGDMLAYSVHTTIASMGCLNKERMTRK
jgi:hypothetical protein